MSDFVEILKDLAPLLTVIIVGFLIVLMIRTAVIRMQNKGESRSEDSDLVQQSSDSNSESNENDSGEDDSDSKYMIKNNVINAIGFQSSDLKKKVRMAIDAQENRNERINKEISQSIEMNHSGGTPEESSEEVHYIFCTSAYEETPFANISLEDRPSIKMLHSHLSKLIASFPMEYRELQRKCLQSNFFKLALRIEIFFFMFNGLLEEYSYDLLQMLIYLRFTDISGAPKVTLINRTEYDELNEIVENLQGQMPDAWGQITDEDLLFKNFQAEDMPR